MTSLNMNDTDQKTKQAWERNWDDITIPQILEIFKYGRVQKQLEIFFRVLPKNDRILEGGCGLAPYLIHLRSLGYDVVGIDYNEGPIKKILAYDPTLPVRVGDVTAIPFPDAHFGAYVSLGVIEHFVEGPEKAIREARRVLKPGGVFLVAVPVFNVFMALTAPSRWLKSRKFLRKLMGKGEDNHYWEQYFDRRKLAAIFEKEGFEVRELHALDHSHALVSFLPSVFRDKGSYDEANSLGLRAGAWCVKNLRWATAAQMTYVCYRKP